jgi:hypothetical protein
MKQDTTITIKSEKWEITGVIETISMGFRDSFPDDCEMDIEFPRIVPDWVFGNPRNVVIKWKLSGSQCKQQITNFKARLTLRGFEYGKTTIYFDVIEAKPKSGKPAKDKA